MVYNARRTREKAAFLAPLTLCGQQKGAKRQFSLIFVDFDQKTQKLHQNKFKIGIEHRFYTGKVFLGLFVTIFFFTDPPPTTRLRAYGPGALGMAPRPGCVQETEALFKTHAVLQPQGERKHAERKTRAISRFWLLALGCI